MTFCPLPVPLLDRITSHIHTDCSLLWSPGDRALDWTYCTGFCLFYSPRYVLTLSVPGRLSGFYSVTTQLFRGGWRGRADMVIQKTLTDPQKFNLQLHQTTMLSPPPSLSSKQHCSDSNCNHFCKSEPYSVWLQSEVSCTWKNIGFGGASCLCVCFSKFALLGLCILICTSRIIVLTFHNYWDK